MQDKILKRSWVTISIDSLLKNLKIYLNNIQESTSIMAVVKADAYGHGAVEISKALQKKGINNFAVSNVMEAVELRQSGVKGQILVLGYTPIENLELIYKYDITQAILSEKYATDIIASNYKIKCQYAIDTGMNRIGLDADNISQCEKSIRKVANNLILTGLFTHLCVADTPSEEKFTREQQSKFENMLEFSTCRYISDDHHIILKGASGNGKTYIACALGTAACRNFIKVRYVCLPDLLNELTVAHGDGTLKKVIKAYQKIDLLILDEFLLSPVSTEQTRELLEIIEARSVKGSVIFCTQFEPKGWYSHIGSDCDATTCEAIIDRIIHKEDFII